jgi:flagellar basal body-associated protein FliL
MILTWVLVIFIILGVLGAYYWFSNKDRSEQRHELNKGPDVKQVKKMK